MRFGSVCSGIEAASVAWGPLGWSAAWFAEIEPFPCAVLKHHYPEVENLGDMTQIPALLSLGLIEAPDILCGGTPCQAFSVAGLRRSLDDARGNLSLTFCEIADAIDQRHADAGAEPCIVFWENVPGVLNTKDNAFGCFLAGLAGEDEPLLAPGGKWANAGAVFGPSRAVAWRVLDAQYFGVAQRRRRVFVVASAREGFDPAAVLFEFDDVRRDTAPRREAGEAAARGVIKGAAIGRKPEAGPQYGETLTDGSVYTLNCVDRHAVIVPAAITMAHGQGGAEISVDRGPTLTCNHEAPIAVYQDTTHTLRGEGFDASEDGAGRGTPLVPVAGTGVRYAYYSHDYAHDRLTDPAGVNPAITAEAHASGNLNIAVPVAYAVRTANTNANGHGVAQDVTHTLDQANGQCVAFSAKDHGADASQDLAPTLRAMGHAGSHANGGGQMAVAFNWNAQPAQLPGPDRDTSINDGLTCSQQGAVAFDTYNQTVTGDTAQTLCSRGDTPGGNAHLVPAVQHAMQVRRLTPRECERLQGFPDDYTLIPWRKKPASECPDGPRYKALGNSWAVPNVRWIGARIMAHVDIC